MSLGDIAKQLGVEKEKVQELIKLGDRFTDHFP